MSDSTKDLLEESRKVADITAGLFRDPDDWSDHVELMRATQTVALIDFALAAHEALKKARASVARGIPSDSEIEEMYGEAFPNHKRLMAETRALLSEIDAALPSGIRWHGRSKANE